jgi:Lar family restriction alleviation protein
MTKSELKVELLPCPFCGGEGLEQIRGIGTQRYVQCGSCFARTKIFKNSVDPVFAWNRRKDII